MAAWRKLAGAACLVLACSGLAACQSTPPTAVAGPSGAEIERAADDILNRFGGGFRDPAVQDYVEAVGRRVLAATPLAADSVEFVLLDTDVSNAFVVPGATIFITRGLLTWLNSEAELAAVIAHEAAHLVESHAAESHSVLRDAEQMALADGLPVLDEAATQRLRQYSREQELEADRVGIQFLVAAGYSGAAAGASQRQFDAGDHIAQLRRGLPGTLPDDERAMATHPSSRQRIAAMTGLAAFNQPGDLAREAYLAAIDGIPFGANADDWLIDGRQIIQPRAGFAFDHPAGYSLAASAGVLSGSGPDDGFLSVDFEIRDPSTSPAAYLNRQFARFGGTAAASEMIGGYPGAAMAFDVTEDGRSWHLIVAAIGVRPDALMRVLAISPANGAHALTLAFEALAESLQRTGARPGAVRRTLVLIEVQPGDSVASLARQMREPQGSRSVAEALLRGINGFGPDQEVAPGDLIKVIR